MNLQNLNGPSPQELLQRRVAQITQQLMNQAGVVANPPVPQAVAGQDVKVMKPVYKVATQVEDALAKIAGAQVSIVQTFNGQYEVVARIPVAQTGEAAKINEFEAYKASLRNAADTMTIEDFQKVQEQTKILQAQQVKQNASSQATEDSAPVGGESR